MKQSHLSKKFGSQSEQLIIDTLIENGFTIQAQNYRKFSGEIDIIAQKKDILAFIEVKARQAPLFDMAELISYTKQKKIIALAKFYCAERNIVDMTCRFDVAFISYENKQRIISIIENAFTESSL